MSIRALFLTIVTRRALSDYLTGVLMVLFILLLVAYTIDLADQFSTVRERAAESDKGLIGVLLLYLGQRGVDIVTRMLPVAIFFGTFLAEIFRRQRLESVILATAGASPLRSYAAVLWLALIVGAFFWALESRIRPVVVWAQVESGIGNYADRFRRGWHEDKWYVRGDVAVRGDVWRAADPYFRDVLVFRGLRSDTLTAILGAKEMRPTDEPNRWALKGVTRYDTVQGDAPQPLPDILIDFGMIADELKYRGFSTVFLPNETLDALARMNDPPADVSAALTQRWHRAIAWLIPGTIAFLAVGMANLGFEGRRILVARLLALALVGYWYVTAIKVVSRMGALDLIAPWIGVLAPLAASLSLAAWLAWRQA